MTVKVYKIRDRNTGLYSTGGVRPAWTAKGKTWSTLAPVKAHLSQFAEYYPWPNNKKLFRLNVPESWEIVTFVSSEEAPIPAKALWLEGR